MDYISIPITCGAILLHDSERTFMDYIADYLSHLTVSQFRTFRKALSVLCRHGVRYNDAVKMLVDASIAVETERRYLRATK